MCVQPVLESPLPPFRKRIDLIRHLSNVSRPSALTHATGEERSLTRHGGEEPSQRMLNRCVFPQRLFFERREPELYAHVAL